MSESRPIIRPTARGAGPLLQAWRRRRGKSQLSLALDAGVSTRHLSFVEGGRAQPSREMVLLLAECLEVPIAERNSLLAAAGFAALYREQALTDQSLAAVQQAIDLILEHQEPYPAIVMDRAWHPLRMNHAARRLFERLLETRTVPGPANVVRMMFHPEGVRRYISNWPEVAGALVRRIHRESIGGSPDEATSALLEEVLGLAGVPLRSLLSSAIAPESALLPVSFRHGELALDFFSTVTTLGSPRDGTLQGLRIECFFPGNDATARAALRTLGGGADGPAGR